MCKVSINGKWFIFKSKKSVRAFLAESCSIQSSKYFTLSGCVQEYVSCGYPVIICSKGKGV